MMTSLCYSTYAARVYVDLHMLEERQDTNGSFRHNYILKQALNKSLDVCNRS